MDSTDPNHVRIEKGRQNAFKREIRYFDFAAISADPGGALILDSLLAANPMVLTTLLL